MNRELKRLFPDIPWQESAQGNPRMRTTALPEGSKKLLNTDHLEEVVDRYYRTYRQPMPILVFLPAICKGAQEEYDVNYVDARSAASMEAAARLVGQGRGWSLKGEE